MTADAGGVHPDEVFRSLVERCSRRDKKDNLARLHEICRLEYSSHASGSRDLSLASIGRAAEIAGLFKARAIYNRQSQDYRSIVESWAGYSGPKVAKVTKPDNLEKDRYAFLDKIADPAVRVLCRTAIAERDRLKNELQLVKSNAEVVIDMRPLGAKVARGATNVALVEVAAQLTDSERSALVQAINPVAIADRRWRIGDVGDILDEHGRFVFFPGFVTAIRKVLKE
jgi:hypothetical protein